MEQTFLAKVVLPVALFIIMLGMGLSLVTADFKRVLVAPKAVAVGAFCQMVLLPLIGIGVVSVIEMEPELAVGILVLSFCPGGTTSNMLSYLSRGDVALSISLTAVVSLVAPLTIPIFTALAMNRLMGEGQSVAMPIGETIVTLLVITVVPVAVGMGVRKRWPGAANKSEKPLKVLSIVFLFAIIAGLIKQNAAELPGFFAQTGVAALLLNVVSMAVGFGVAKLAGLNRKQQITIGIEVGIQNGTTALLVTGTLLANKTMTIGPAIYSLIMFVTGALFGVIVNMGRAEETGAEAEPG